MGHRHLRRCPTVKLRGVVRVTWHVAFAMICCFVTMPESFVEVAMWRTSGKAARIGSRLIGRSVDSKQDALQDALNDPDKAKELQEMAQKMVKDPALQDLLKDPDKVKALQEMAKQMVNDPTQMQAAQAWQRSVMRVLNKLKTDPELEEFFQELKENGVTTTLKKYEQQDWFKEKLKAAKVQINEEYEGLVGDIFRKFDEDKDGFLSLAEFNSLQSLTEGTDAVYESEQLTSLLLAVNPEIKEPEKGMPFADFRRLYIDPRLSVAYGTDVVGDHAKIFGSDDSPADVLDVKALQEIFGTSKLVD